MKRMLLGLVLLSAGPVVAQVSSDNEDGVNKVASAAWGGEILNPLSVQDKSL